LTQPIVHITHRDDWTITLSSGEYSPGSLSKEGFIHCSRPGQVVRVAETFYAGQQGLVLLVIDPARLRAELRWEPGADKPDEIFPHIFGPLNLDAVTQVLDFNPGPDGQYVLPNINPREIG
jgi:uncharacterized protein (DUF952 family)